MVAQIKRESLFVLLASLLVGVVAEAQESPEPAAPLRLPGLRDNGQILLPNQWSLRPAGKQIVLGDFPVQIAVHPQLPLAAVLHAGYGEHEVVVVKLPGGEIVSRASVPQAFYGLSFSPKGDRIFVSGGEDEVVHQFQFDKGYLSQPKVWKVAESETEGVIAGVTADADGKTLWVADAWGDSIVRLDLANGQLKRLALPEDSYPYAILPSRDGRRAYVSLWGAASVAVVDVAAWKAIDTVKVQPHPTEMLFSRDGQRLFVACANSNTVAVVSLAAGRAEEMISSALYPNADPGSTPNSIDLSPDGKVLLVANADNNNVAVFDVSEPRKSRSLGYIPVGWYPTSVRFGPEGLVVDGERRGAAVLVANGKGMVPRANRQGPNPLNNLPRNVQEYIGRLFQGTLSVIDSPGPGQMAAYTRDAFACSPLRKDKQPVLEAPQGSPIPAKVGGTSPIKHCIYVVKENRTYDQVLGDMPRGNGDPSLCIFPEKITPNHHALAREFVLLDNFYVESEVSADGHEWSMAAYATDFVEKSWPLTYRGGRGTIGYPSEGSYKIAPSAGGYIWDRCKEAGVSYYSFGEFIADGGTPRARALVETLEGHFDPRFRSYDLDYPDVKRTARFLEKLKQWEDAGEMPRFIVIRLPNDHTYGTRAGKLTPTAMMADNDLALGQLVEGVSRSKFWPETAIFVVQDDAQNGSDHVDAHRTIAFVASPYTRRGVVDSTMYSTSSMLRTMELILGLKPMTQFDAAATPMYASFTGQPDPRPFTARPANVDLHEKNAATAWGADLSAKMDFSREDAADDLLLNEVVWRSVRGADSPMPPPVRASFVFQHGEDEDEDERDEADD